MNLSKWLICIPLILLVSCDKGIAPEQDNVEPGFSGTVTFQGEWPANVTRTHLVLFKDPLLSEEDFNAENLVYVSGEITYGAEEYNYNTLEGALLGNVVPGEYAYLAVAQSNSLFISLERSAWRVVGVYYNGDESQPGKVIIPEGTFVTGININCDFNNPPQQPPGGSQ
jgi:hypothetical protein